MTAKGVHLWSTTAASNNTADSGNGVAWSEGQAPSSVNDSARAEMSSVALWRDDLNGTLVTGGGTTAYTLTTNQAFASLAAGLEVTFTMNATNTGTSTLAVDGLPAKPLRASPAVEVLAGALLIGAVYRAVYKTSNSGEWIVQGYPVLGDAQIAAAKLASNSVTTAKIADANVTYAKIQDVTATKRALGRNTSGSGDVEEVTYAQMQNWLGTPARGDMIRQGASDPERVTIGTAGKVWTSDGTDPGWALPSRSLLATLTASNSAELGDDDIFTSDYAFYEIEYTSLLLATNSQEMRFQIYSGSYRATGYITIATGIYTSGSGATQAPTTHIPIQLGNNEGHNVLPGHSGKLRIYNPSANAKCQVSGEFLYKYSAANYVARGTSAGWWDTAGVVTGFRFIPSSGNITSGTAKVYGYN